MYFSTSQYPNLRTRSSAEQLRIVAAAKEWDKWASRRFWLAAITLFGGAVVVSCLSALGYITPMSSWIPASIAGVAFYLFLLWDVNGPTLRAVEQYLSKHPEP